MSERQRQSEAPKTAVFLGSYAVNPASGARMPILISDYVLPSYGTGAIMAVPAHDQRDYELATAISLPIVPVVRPSAQWLSERAGAVVDAPETWRGAYDGDGELINSRSADISLDGLGVGEAKSRAIQWLESSGLGTRRMVGPGEGGRVGGVDLYIGGVEHAVLHLLYARFWHKILFDLGYVSTPEPFHRLYNQGYILADAFTSPAGRYVPACDVVETEDGLFYEGERVRRHHGKMGKSLKNSVSPDEIHESYGADTLRMYEMAMGPLDADRPWQPDDIVGVYRFLQRLWRNIIDEQTGELRPAADPLPASDPLYKLAHRTIDAVTRYFGELRFNVATARLADLNNALTQFVLREGVLPWQIAEALVLVTFPLAPHVTSELWERLGHYNRIDDVAFPIADPSVLEEAFVIIPVTVDGRPRGTISLARDASEADAAEAGLGLDSVVKAMEARELSRVVFVPGKILNLVTRDAKERPRG